MLTPKELGFDAKVYPNWRRFQYQTIQRILTSTKRFIILSAPTGAGKSAIALGVARLLLREGKVTTILTKDTRLQDQYMAYEFPDHPPKTGMGRRNFPCILPGEDCMADKAPCTDGFDCPLSHPGTDGTPQSIPCPYYQQRAVADAAPIRVLNYPFYFFERLYGMFKSDVIICDEGHNVDSEILKHLSVVITKGDLETIKSLRLRLAPPEHELLTHCRKLLDSAATIEHAARAVVTKKGADAPDEVKSLAKKMAQIGFLSQKMVHVSQEFKFSPILPDEFAPSMLLNQAGKVVLMSATIFGPEYWQHRLGARDVDYIELPSTFPPENRPVIYDPVAYFNKDDWNEGNEWKLERLAKKIDGIIRDRLPKKGIIHTVSYRRALDYINRSMFKSSDLLILGQTREDIARFINSPMGILVSPSITEGIDLPDELCQYVIWMKVPFPNEGDPVIKLQKEIDKSVYQYQTVSTVVQGSGRGMRHDQDFCEVFILDKAWSNTYRQVQLPAWFTESFVGLPK